MRNEGSVLTGDDMVACAIRHLCRPPMTSFSVFFVAFSLLPVSLRLRFHAFRWGFSCECSVVPPRVSLVPSPACFHSSFYCSCSEAQIWTDSPNSSIERFVFIVSCVSYVLKKSLEVMKVDVQVRVKVEKLRVITNSSRIASRASCTLTLHRLLFHSMVSVVFR